MTENRKVIWKYDLKPGINTFTMHQGAKPLTVQTQFGSPELWALVMPSNPIEDRTFVVVATGEPITEDIQEYIGTFQLEGGALIFHVFEVIP